MIVWGQTPSSAPPSEARCAGTVNRLGTRLATSNARIARIARIARNRGRMRPRLARFVVLLAAILLSRRPTSAASRMKIVNYS
jgi:hypothetical protein